MVTLKSPDVIAYERVAAPADRSSTSPSPDRVPESNWHKRLIEGLEENQFRLYHQRIVSIQPHIVLPGEHVEVLLRLNTNARGIIGPAAFMPAARRLRLLQEIDRWVIQAVFERAGAERLRGAAAVNYAINLSGPAIGDEGLLLYILE